MAKMPRDQRGKSPLGPTPSVKNNFKNKEKELMRRADIYI
jgi:hypothetical protein